jgi:citrate lyase subunit beta/citryl-CoA lyase
MFERSFHFVPAHQPRFLRKLHTLEADALVFDLEDAVPAELKRGAINELGQFLATLNLVQPLYVRVNGSDTEWTSLEARLLASRPELGIVLPKVRDPDSIRKTLSRYGITSGRRRIFLIEDFHGLTHVQDIARMESVTAIGVGMEDCYSTLRFPSCQLEGLSTRIRTDLAIHCHAAGIMAIDSISTDLQAGIPLEQDLVAARSAGLTSKFSIHPLQIPVINRLLSPSEEAITEARRIGRLASSHSAQSGYHVVQGEIISPPKLKKSHTVIAFSDHHEIHP